MTLPISTSLEPMHAKLVAEIPAGGGWLYEPKWDGFRCLAFRDGEDVDLRSKNGQPLARYFPEIVQALRELKPAKFVLDGEIVIPQGSTISFDALLQRIHPAPSRIRKLSTETPGLFIVFDLLVNEKGRSLVDLPQAQRRTHVEAFAANHFQNAPGIRLSPATDNLKTATKWFARIGGALDGIIAKRNDLPYQSGNRDGMVKVKAVRTADCVVGGFRYAAKSPILGSLLLGLYGNDGLLHHVGFCSSFKAAERKKLVEKLKPLIKPPGFTGQSPGGPSRWSTKRSEEWEPLAHRLVVEVRYDHFTGGRFRHGTQFLRWRPDKAPRQCTMDQVAQESNVSPLKLLKNNATVRRR